MLQVQCLTALGKCLSQVAAVGGKVFGDIVESWAVVADGLTALLQPWNKLMMERDLSLLPAGVRSSPNNAPFGTIWDHQVAIHFFHSSYYVEINEKTLCSFGGKLHTSTWHQSYAPQLRKQESRAFF